MPPSNEEEQGTLQNPPNFGNATVQGHASAILGTVNYATHHYHFAASVDHDTRPAVVFSNARHVFHYIDASSRLLALITTLHQHGFETVSSTENVSRSKVYLSNSSGKFEKIVNDYTLLEENMTRIHVAASGFFQDRADDTTDGQLLQLTSRCYKTFPLICQMFQCANLTREQESKEATRAAFQLAYATGDITSLQGQITACRSQLIECVLATLKEHVSRPVEQQLTTLDALGVKEDSLSDVQGMAASILRYLISDDVARRSVHDDPVHAATRKRTDGVKRLVQELVQVFYTTTSDSNPRPQTIIHPTPDDRRRVEVLFLHSLEYEGMQDRENRVATAHETTFRWVLDERKDDVHKNSVATQSGLRKWLESEDQLFWITGKAGSGKSTLIKFLSSPAIEQCQTGEGRCHSRLRRWSGELRLMVVSFYFWDSGMELQTTKLGLLRTLLHQIATQRPDIMPQIAPKRWELMCLFHLASAWTIQQLHDMLLRAIHILNEDSKICFFIDGLDEFSSNHEDLICLIKNLVGGSPHVKVCVASRPWEVFQDALGCHPHLRLEDLTFDDVKAYVQSRFRADSEFDSLRKRYPEFADDLMTQIVVKAVGVFLWVDVVVSSLLAGIHYGDRIQDFQRRLDELPPDLEDLYEKILRSLDLFYLSHAAQYFSLVEKASTPLTLLQFSFADEGTLRAALELTSGFMKDGEVELRIQAMGRRLNNRCRGLLETERAFLSPYAHNPRTAAQLTVQYLHQTVKDFVRSPKAQDFLRSSSQSSFDPSLQLCIAYIMCLKAWTGSLQDDTIPRMRDVQNCFRQAACVSHANHGSVVILMDELKSLIHESKYKQALLSSNARPTLDLVPPGDLVLTHEMSRGQALHMIPRAIKVGPFDLTTYYTTSEGFLAAAVAYNVVPYINARADRGGLVRRYDTDGQFPLLLVALSNDVPEPEMIESLLEIGADPNFKISDIGAGTPWKFALTRVTILYTVQLGASGPVEYQVAENKWRRTLELMFLQGGDCTNIQESLLSPISRKILHDIKQKHSDRVQSTSAWRRFW